MHLVYPLKFCISVVFDFSWDDCNTKEKLETTVTQNLGGGGKQDVLWCMWKWWIDLFSLYVLFSHYRPCDVTPGNCFLQKSRYPRAYSCINEKTEGKVPWVLYLVWIGKIKPTRSISTDATRKKRPLQNAGNKKWDHTGCKLWLSLCLNKGCMYVYVV